MGIASKIFGVFILFLSFSTSYAGERIIVIDVGHGGKDKGVEIDGFLEKDLTYEIAKRIMALNTDSDLKIILTREFDDFVSLENRVSYINSLNPDFLISIHINSDADTRINGFGIHVSPDNPRFEESQVFAQEIENHLSNELTANGTKESNFYILKNIKIPSVTLELGYLSNAENRRILTSEAGQESIAEAIYKGIK